MKHLIFFFALISTSFLVGQNVSSKWVRQVGGSEYDIGNAITVDAADNLYITGHFQGLVDFDPSASTFTLNAIGQDVFILKLDSSGSFIWAKQIGGYNGDADGLAIKTDRSGNVYTTGVFAGSADFDPGIGAYDLTSANDFSSSFIWYDVFVSKLDSSGNFIWAKQFGGYSHDYGRSIAIDNLNNVYVGGEFEDQNVDFDPGTNTFYLSAEMIDAFISKLDSNGNFIWAKRFGGNQPETVYGLSLDKYANVYSTGLFQDTCDFDPSSATFNLPPASSIDAFITKLDSSGNFIWAKRVGGAGQWKYNSGKAIATDSSGNIHVAGYFSGSGDFDPGNGIYNLSAKGNWDTFILKLDSTGSFIWAKQIGGFYDETAESLVLDDSGNLYITGFFQDTCDFDPSPVINKLVSKGAWDIFVCKLNSSGDLQWAKNMGGTQIDEGTSIAIDSQENVYTTGRFIGTADFDPNPGVFNLTMVGGNDIFIHRLSNGSFVGLKENIIDSDVTIYPNPTTGKINFKTKDKITSIKIFNITSQIIFESTNFNADKFTIDISNHCNGIYFIEALLGENVYRTKLIKN